MSTPVTNFGKVTVSTGYNAAATSIVLTAGHGSRLPSTFPYPLTWWNATDYPDPADDPNREIVTVTNRAGDTLTVTRGAESSGASTKNAAGKTYKMIEGITKAMWEDMETRSLSQSAKNLTIETHPQATAGSTLIYINADSITMNDGEEVQDWSGVDIVSSASGAGGLDTGTLQADTCYEIYALWNGTTKNACIHRAKDMLLDVDTSATITEDATQGIRSNVDNSTVQVSQGFKLNTAGPIPYIEAKLIKVGAPTGNIWFRIETNSAGKPSGTLAHASATTIAIGVSRIQATAAVIRFPFLNLPTLSAATTYHLVALGDWAVSNSDYVGWRMDGSAAAYADGNKCLYDSDTLTWTADTDDDMIMSMYVEENDVDIASTVPSGYRYAHIGYVFTNSTPNFIVFTQVGQEWRFRSPQVDGILINEIAASVSPLDFRAVLPPRKRVIAQLAVTGTGAAVGSAVIGLWNAPGVSNGTISFAEQCLGTNSTAEVFNGHGRVCVEYQTLFIDGSAGADLYLLGFTW